MGRDTKPLLWVSSKTQRTKEPAAAMSSKKSPLRRVSAGLQLLSKEKFGWLILNKIFTELGVLFHICAFFLEDNFRAYLELFRFSRKDCNHVQRRKEGLFLV